MIINEISLKNFKSFGNSTQTLKLNTDKGELVLLVGNNGNGKSSLISSFDFVLYGKCKGNKKKWATLATIPNRINSSDTLVGTKFYSNGVEVEVKRGLSPNKLELWENGILNEKAGKGNIDSKIENYIGMDIETFKSFISMSINDFKNFISLSTEEKQLLLDKLFNLETINILNSILKDINKNNKLRINSLDTEIRTLEDSILSINESISKAIEREKENIQQELDEILIQINSKKDEFTSLKDKINKIKEKEQILLDELNIENKQYIVIQNDIKNVNQEINLYDSGKCPTCSTDFNNEHFFDLKASLLERKKSYINIQLEIENNIKTIKERQTKLKSISDKTKVIFDDLNFLLRSLKSKADDLDRKNKKSSEKDLPNIKEFENTISELKSRKKRGQDSLSDCKDKEMYYKELGRLFSDEGVKKSIISGIIKPINIFINQNIKKMELPFEVNLDETFTAQIKSLSNTIEHDTLSTGETKLINISILVAYLKLIRTKKHINILFLDEVFSSIDLGNISKILELLKSFASEYNINIFVVHHAILNQEIFDKIIRIEKNVFSSIEEVIINN